MFLIFYRPESSNFFPVKTHVFESPCIFYTFVCKHGALHLRLHVVALPASVTMSWPAKITAKLNMSGLDFLVPNSFDVNAFFQVLFSSNRTVCGGNVNLLLSESLRSTVFFARSRTFFLFFFRSEGSNGFPVKSMFSESLSFLQF